MKPYAAMERMIPFWDRVKYGPRNECGTRPPTITAASTPTTPMMLASTIRPGLMRYIQRPTSRAIGMVIAIVNVPHELSRSALTTAKPRPASATMMMMRTAIEATAPATGLISWRAISASDLPWRRTEATSTRKSWTPPARIAPSSIQISPGAYPNWAASTGPISGPAPEIAAKWWPKRTNLFVGW